ncbi:low molecular weight neuronal intermediate filament-like [Callorhinchus milii]|uniref:low molecular weight neuronal intermediate filament-like n=1 Tax=Callorhinchus milii TaxID=7868 RepID=UPI000457530A|nr:low molecular weight neuronal intermediate filament-like [Callorhinchus milii]|eukprot:gi/632948697/ref/XP_007889746.1/ PREDICTED: keratin, type I cytoskeletal 13-like [Callorhinchus milii]
MFSGNRASSLTSSACQELSSVSDVAGECSDNDFHDGIVEGKVQIKGLNERFTKYINNTVLNLQRKNKELLAELKRLQREEFTAVENAYEKDKQEFMAKIEETQNEMALLRVEKDRIKTRLDKEAVLKREFDRDFQELKKKYDDGGLTIERLQCQLKALEAQLVQLKVVKDAERVFWQQKVDNLQNLELSNSSTMDLGQSLRHMRHEYEQMAKRNKDELERFKQKFEENNVPLQKIKKEIEAYRGAVNDLKIKDGLQKNQMQEKEREMNRIKEYNKALEKKLDSHAAENQNMFAVNAALEQELLCYKSLLSQVEKKAKSYNAPPCVATPPAPTKPAEDWDKMC